MGWAESRWKHGSARGVQRMTDGVAIIGGGASGSLTALAMAGIPGLGPLTLVDTGGVFARGVAYSTEDPVHLLNVPAGRMSAFADQPSHLLAWLAARGDPADPEAFLPRRQYGAYLGELLHGTGERVRRRVARVDALAPEGAGLRLALAGGEALKARAAVLALGNFAPELPPGWSELPGRLAWRSPWGTAARLAGAGRRGAPARCGPDGRGRRASRSMRVGTGSGLTSSPAAGSCRPRAGTDAAALLQLGPQPRAARAGAAGPGGRPARGPRAVLDTLRPELGALWQGPLSGGAAPVPAPSAHLVRHPPAPARASGGARIAALEAEGRLIRHAGRWSRSRRRAGGWPCSSGRGGHGRSRCSASTWPIPPTGPVMDACALEDPLVRSLLGLGQARPGRSDSAWPPREQGRCWSSFRTRLWTLGGLRRGDLGDHGHPRDRVQARALAGTIAAALGTRPA